MNMFRRACALMVCMCLSLCLFGCSRESESNVVASEKDEDRLTIGISFDSFLIERWQRDRDVFVSTAKELGAEVYVQNANGEVKEQIDQIEYFINKKVDVIVLVTIDADALTEAVAKAKKAGIPVICYDRLVRNANADLYISFDNEMVGRQMARAICDEIGEDGRIIEVRGPKSDGNVAMVMKGFEDVCLDTGANAFEGVSCDEWRPEIAYQYVSEHIEELAETDAIVCGNDSLAGEVIHALAEHRLAGGVLVTGQDAELEACQRIVEGTQLMTVYKPVEKLAKIAAECAVKLAKGEHLSDTVLFEDGTYSIPYIAIEPIAVNKGNIDEVIIGSGFHLKEDVYMNVSGVEKEE